MNISNQLIKCFFIIFFMVIVCTIFASCQKKNAPSSSSIGSFFNNPPTDSTELYAPGIISTNLNERDIAFTPDGQELYYTLWTGSFGVILFVKQEENQLTRPQVASFSGRYSDLEPVISTDGTTLFFVSNRPLEENGKPKDYDIWFVEKTATGWGEPQNPGSPINTDKNEFYPSVTSNSTLYYTAGYEGSLGGEDIYRSKLVNGKYTEPGNLGNSINSKADEFNALIAPDEGYLIFSSFGRDDGIGGGDLYVSFKNEDGSWTKAKNMGSAINSTALDYCPAISPDGKYFYFTSRRTTIERFSESQRTYNGLRDLLNKPQNGMTDIYWIDSQIIKNLKAE